MLISHGVFTMEELKSRVDIMLENYCKTIVIEANTMVDMAKTQIAPAVDRYASDLAKDVAARKAVDASLPCRRDGKLIARLSALTDEIDERTEALESAMVAIKETDGIIAESAYIRDSVLPAMSALRIACDEAETLTAKEYWPYPSYGDILFSVK